MIERLSLSQSFAETRIIVWGLDRYDEFSKNQVDRIIEASIANNQIHNEMYTAQRFLKKLIARHMHTIDPGRRKTLEKLME